MFKPMAFLALASAAIMLATPSMAGPDDWLNLQPEHRQITETVRLKPWLGQFHKIRLSARGGDVIIDEVRIHLDKGETQKFRINRRLRDGELSPPIAISARSRSITVVEVDYRGSTRENTGSVVVQGQIGDDPAGYGILESRYVAPNSDKVTLPIGRGEGRFSSIKLRVWEAPLMIRRAEIDLGRGRKQEVRIREKLEPGEATDPIDLPGNLRAIREITLYLRPQRSSDNRPRIDVLGKEGPSRGHHGDSLRGWDRLGSGHAGFLKKDTDSIHVGRNKGRFTAVRLRAANQQVRLYSMRIVYGNGTTEDVRISGTLQAGEISAPFDLKGRDRFIDRIELRYRTKLSLRGPAEVEVWGREAR